MSEKQIVFVTGASSGIGKAVAELFAREGYVVYGTSRQGKYQATDGGGASFVMLPMTLEDEATIRDAVQYILARHGRIDVLVNAAGSGIAGAVEETTSAEARLQFDVCLFGVVSVLNYVLPAMRAAQNGVVLNIGSVASFFPLPFQGMYSAAKAALYSMTCAMGLELKPFGIRVCQIEPGDTRTGFTQSRVLTEKSKDSVYKEQYRRALYEMVRSELAGYEPERCARTVLKAARMKRPPMRLCVDVGYKILSVLAAVLPWGVAEKVISSMYLKKDPPAEWRIDQLNGGQ
jgi:NAD(P)-dependent dehydrogenase (short-subunit alcohol dehydrogenase family)